MTNVSDEQKDIERRLLDLFELCEKSQDEEIRRVAVVVGTARGALVSRRMIHLAELAVVYAKLESERMRNELRMMAARN